jgi:hypothetical protein
MAGKRFSVLSQERNREHTVLEQDMGAMWPGQSLLVLSLLLLAQYCLFKRVRIRNGQGEPNANCGRNRNTTLRHKKPFLDVTLQLASLFEFLPS